MKVEVENISDYWGLDKEWLLESVNSFTTSQLSTIPYIDELTKSVDYEKASYKSAGNKLRYIMTINRVLPKKIMELK